MIDIIEDIRNEFKLKITEKFEEEVIAFLNTNGGNIYLGIDNNDKIVGINQDIDSLQMTIKDRIKNNIMPSTLGLFDVVVEEKENKKYIKIIIARGSERPYYLKGMGMTPDSCFIRVGSSIQSMPSDMINNEFSKRTRNSLKNIVSPKQDLTFSELKIFYEEKGYFINENFLNQLELYNENGKFNYVAYLLSDNNSISILFGKYEGPNAVNLIENEDFGNCSLIKATKNILNKIKIENKIFTKVEYPERKEIKMYDYDAVREAVVNAIVHNDWSNGYSPKFEMFNDRLVISSNGGIQDNVSKDEFLQGFSLPRNKELMKVFRDLNLVEQMGTGIIRILKTYDKDSFEFFPNFIRVTFPFNKNELKLNQRKIDNNNLTEIQNAIINLIMDSPTITQETLARLLNVNIRTIQRNIKILVDTGLIEREGATKKGHWNLLDYKFENLPSPKTPITAESLNKIINRINKCALDIGRIKPLNLKFENLPSTKTPITAENLNKIIDKLNECITKLDDIKPLDLKFEDYPSTKTPITAENLNKIVDKTNEVILYIY